jgi:hypothetical protein
MIDTKSQIQQFLTLQNKTVLELKAICEGMQLETTGDKKDLIDRLVQLNIVQQESVVHPQAIPLRTRDSQSHPLPAAIKCMKEWRRIIFQAKGNTRDFNLTSNDGTLYTLNMKFAKCSINVLNSIVANDWYLPLPKYKDIFALVQKNPQQFNFNIIQKPAHGGNTWLMLHIEPRYQNGL